MNFNNNFEVIYQKLLSDKTKVKSEQIILVIAIASFLIHLFIIFLVDFDLISLKNPSDFLKNPIAAIYTPFSFILVYEVYLLIYYLPKSISTYIGKQYEIITLIIIRRLFKDLSTLTLSFDWFKINHDLQFTFDLLASVLLFYFIFLFHLYSKKRFNPVRARQPSKVEISRFIKIKKAIAALLVPILIVLAVYSFLSWSLSVIYPNLNFAVSFKNLNNIFFEQFFTILIIADVILLLFSFFHTDEFHKVIRNSGFIISTILIRLSFSFGGIINTVLIVSAVVFGLLILIVHNKFEKYFELEPSHGDTDNHI